MGECALWVLFAPPFASQVPHLPLVNCGLARLRGTKITSQNPLAEDFFKDLKGIKVIKGVNGI